MSKRLVTRFSVFDEWAEIPDPWEPAGAYLESIQKGAFAKTFREQRKQIKVLYAHGRDSRVGDRPLGVIEDLREEDDGAYGEVRLLDVDYVNELIPALRENLMGASFRFQPLKDRYEPRPGASSYNPDGLPERVRTEVRLREFGPVTWGAYTGAGNALRSASEPAAPIEIEDVSMRMFPTRHSYLRWLDSKLSEAA